MHVVPDKSAAVPGRCASIVMVGKTVNTKRCAAEFRCFAMHVSVGNVVVDPSRSACSGCTKGD